MRLRVATGLGMSYPVYAVLLLFFIFTGCKSTASYDFDLYTRVDAPADSLRKLAALPLQVTWTSPTFHVFREEVYLPMEGKMSLFSKQVRAPYRAGVRPEEWGPWQVVVRVQDPPEGLCGMGLVVSRNKD